VPGTDVKILIVLFAKQKLETKLASGAQIISTWAEKRIITMVLTKSAIFPTKIGENRQKLAKIDENWRKSTRIVILTLTPRNIISFHSPEQHRLLVKYRK
jgi:regulator of extracellular matrix RemA (YlzA/DUF370 family)